MAPSATGAPVSSAISSPTVTPAQPASPAAPSTVSATIRFVLPTVGQAGHIRTPLSATRALQSISPSTASIKIVVTPLGGTSSTNTGPCIVGSCTVSFSSTTGPNTIAFTLTDGAGGTGNVLGSYTTTIIIQPTPLTTYSFSANPVVDHVTLGLGAASVVAGTAAKVALTVNAFDIGNNLIVGNGPYVDVNGNQLALSLSVMNNQAGGKGNVSILGPLRITGPGQTPIFAAYDGRWLDNSVISVTSSRPLAGSLGAATLPTIPHVIEFSGLTGPAFTDELSVGPDGNIWFTENTAHKIGRMTTTGILTEFSTGLLPGSALKGIVTGADGNMWFGDDNGPCFGKITMSGAITEYPTGLTGASPDYLTLAPDGNIWLTEFNSSQIARISTNGAVTEFPTASNPRSITPGPDGDLWYLTNFSPEVLGRTTLNGKTTEFPVLDAGPLITEGPDGNMWTSSYSGNQVYKITPSLAITSYPVPGNPVGIVTGPDGNLWVTEQLGNSIDRVTTSGVVTRYSNGLTAGAQPYAITLGPDKNLYFVESAIKKIGKFVL